jgi:outer membrane receptor protein involved in Fe transport
MGFEVDGITWENISKSNVKGVEFEVKKKLSKSFDIRSNVTLVKSISQFVVKELEVIQGIKYYTPVDTINRVMFGQAPYIVNLIASYTHEKLGLNASITYNIQGPRLVISSAIKGMADVYEMPRNMIDFKMTKSIKKHFTVSLTVRDLLNAKVRREYKTDNGYQTYDSYRYGTNVQLGIIYKL